ncbi:MAG: prolipoprotein diacylglyceryl transferase [Ruminococcaceae bacterium]|nr:prolipoprotein diacylglyceryl transferase [Oscillospiraceae bacterium]
MNPVSLLYYYMSFPGLGLNRDFHIDPTAITLGNLEIKWYGLIIVCGMIAAVAYTYLQSRRHGLIFDDLLDIALSSIIPGVLGARLYYVVFDGIANPEKYSTFYDVIAIWEGGLAIYGGLIFGVLGAIIALKIKKIRIPTMLDCAFPGILLAQSIGRWGNFVNMEAYGAETTWFCRMRLSSESGLLVTEVHPTFLYESLWNLVGFIILTLLFKKRKFDGQIFLMAVSWYGLGRFFIEGLRQDSLYIGQLRVSQLLAAVLFIVALGLLIYGFIISKERRVKECIYVEGTKKYEDFMAKGAETPISESPAEDTAPASEESAIAEEKVEEETVSEIVEDPEKSVEDPAESTENTEKTDE